MVTSGGREKKGISFLARRIFPYLSPLISPNRHDRKE
jgi:hypothetical protein